MKKKFHAKTYITYFRDEYKSQFIDAMNIPSGYALVGSSNFTKAGLTDNIELNVQVNNDVDQLQQWFDKRWEESTDITETILKVMETNCKEYSPYDVYVRSMYEYFKTQDEPVSEWEKNDSVIYPQLSQYQKDGYNNLITIANRYSGAFLCDGVGLGKTYIGLILIERFVKKERKRVVLIVPAATRESVWINTIKEYMPELISGFDGGLFKIINHTDLTLENKKDLMNSIAKEAEIVIIDEAHHFRNKSSQRYKKLYEIMGANSENHKKQLYMLTATPINNSFNDLKNLIQLFTQNDDKFFSSTLGISSLEGYIRKLEKKLNDIVPVEYTDTLGPDVTDAVFKADKLVSALVVQRSRNYVKKSLNTEEEANVLFPIRKDPDVAGYSLKNSYGKLIYDFKTSFERKDKNGKKLPPIVTLAIYAPYGDPYFIGNAVGGICSNHLYKFIKERGDEK